MANDYADKELPRAKDQIAPAVYDDSEEDWVVVKGRDGRMWVRDDSVESKLDDVISKLEELIEETKK